MGCCQSTPVIGTKPPTPKTSPPQPLPKVSKPQDKTPTNGVSSSNIAATPVELILNLTDKKPLDASDISNLEAAKKEIQNIRKFALEYLDNIDENVESEGQGRDGQNEHFDDRGALYDKQDFSSFKKVSYEKTDAIRSLIYDAIKPNELFEHDTNLEILQIIDVFKPQTFSAGQRVINQGDEGSEFYVVESGKLSIHVTVEGNDGSNSKVKVGDYSSGSAFGELALIFGSPRAATITASTDCKLWSIERTAYRSVMQQLRYEQHIEKKKFLATCVVAGREFTDIFGPSQIEDLTIAIKIDTYDDGQVILREGEMGDTFYIVKSGSVETLNRGRRDKVLEEKEVFGTTSLLKKVGSPVTYKAVSHVTLYYLTRNDFESIMGSFEDAFEGNSVYTPRERPSISTRITTDRRHVYGLDDLTTFNVLGRGAFGRVKLVQCKTSKKVFALKEQSKHYIEMKGQKEHVLNEYRIMMDVEHPNILGIHCAMQDKKNLYFLLDLLPGGELMTYLRKCIRLGGGFSEDVTRFYAATVVRAYEQLHTFMIAYRDLKPENIVLNKNGYGVVVDFGLAKEIDEGQSFTLCGTPDYLAPEIIRGTGHDWAVDYWGLGIFLFEMTHGTAPFYATNQSRRARRILKGFECVRMPSHFSGGLSDIITKLLNGDQSKRFGRTHNGVKDIINHYWFAGFDWERFSEQSMTAPIQPDIPNDIKTLGKKETQMKDSDIAIDSDWWPDLDLW
mmetsp:Transcript_7714/g.11571  ORF Transcript_7714/g.11571 Transcript_7714/m.11571 type:complete len:731 (-) Transcript_7714:119-2311(-)